MMGDAQKFAHDNLVKMYRSRYTTSYSSGFAKVKYNVSMFLFTVSSNKVDFR